MKRTFRALIGLALMLGLTAVAGVLAATTNEAEAATAQSSTSSMITQACPGDAEEAYADGVVDILLGDQIVVAGEGATVEGTTVSITAAGVYSISGTLTDGCIDIDAKGKVYLEFDAVDITSSRGPALSVTDAKKVTITLVEGTTNFLADTARDGKNDATLFTNDTLIINGRGTLVVTGNDNEGISSDDDIIINSGTVRVTAVDDALNAHDDITINDGDVVLIAGGDGLDSNGTVHVNGGTLVSFGSAAQGEGGIDVAGALVIMGGTVIAGGGSVAIPDDDSTQCSLYVAAGLTQAPGTRISAARKGEVIFESTAEKAYQYLLISRGDLVDGASYEVSVGDGAMTCEVVAAATPTSVGTSLMEAGATR